MVVIIRRIRDFALGAFGIFLAFGFVPIVAGALIASALGHPNLAEDIIVFGFVGWIVIRTCFVWLANRGWQKAEALRIKEGRESPGDILRREKWEREKLRRKEYLREAMRLRAEAKRSKSNKGST